jgi:glycosyltransferase involved in cell wall biosynthesis
VKKIAFVTYALNVGGMESMLLTLARGLRGYGFAPHFIITDNIGAWHERIRDEGFPVEAVLPSPLESRQRHVRRLAATLAGHDVVLLNHSRAGQSAIGLLPNMSVTISVLHNNDEDIFDVGLANHTNMDALVAVGHRVQKEAEKRGVRLAKLACIRNGVEIFPSFPKKEAATANDGLLKVIYLGRITHKQKGIFYLPRILAEARAKSASIILDIVGEGPDLGVLRNLFYEHKSDDAVTIHGPLPHNQAMDFLLSADVLIMPSHYEGQPIILFEAMARGVVPVVSRLKGITDTVIEDGVTGFLAPVGDEKAFADSLVRLTQIDFRRKVSHAAWKTAVNNFSAECMTRSFVHLINQCIEKRKKGMLPERTQTVDISLLGKFSNFPIIFQNVGSELKKVLRGSGIKGNKHGN